MMKCYGTCQMLRGLIKDITGLSSEIHMRNDANNLVTTASTTHVPEQQETIHMIQMLGERSMFRIHCRFVTYQNSMVFS